MGRPWNVSSFLRATSRQIGGIWIAARRNLLCHMVV
uniref:Uncharacterized protein n=1 Tax=Arundo donax TaxID=35708 RepID=A0A0A9AXT9_ARUDO